MAPAVGFEPTTNRLTADRSTTELRWINTTSPSILTKCNRPKFLVDTGTLFARGSYRISQLREGIIKRIATGLYRSSASGVYFAHVGINGKLFRDSLATADRKTADRNCAISGSRKKN